MKIARTLRFELDAEELSNVQELTIVLNGPNGQKTFCFNQDFDLMHDKQNQKSKLVRRRAIRFISSEKPVSIETVIESALDEKFESQTLLLGKFLPMVPATQESLPFKKSVIKPYTMAETRASLESLVTRFIYGKNRKSFEEKIFAFFIDNPTGQKFNFRTVTIWNVGLWMLMDPDALLEACGGAITFRAIEFAFRDVRKQLEERVLCINGHMPKLASLEPVKRKYSKRRRPA